MKKKIIIIFIVIILFVPIPLHLKDGGTIEYQALTYKISKIHRLIDDGRYEKGIILKIFGVEIYNNVKQYGPKRFQDEELRHMALEYFFQNATDLLPKEEYEVGISNEVIPKYQNQDMVVIEIRHINNMNNTLDARYYINIYTAKGFDDLANEIDLNL